MWEVKTSSGMLEVGWQTQSKQMAWQGTVALRCRRQRHGCSSGLGKGARNTGVVGSDGDAG